MLKQTGFLVHGLYLYQGQFGFLFVHI